MTVIFLGEDDLFPHRQGSRTQVVKGLGLESWTGNLSVFAFKLMFLTQVLCISGKKGNCPKTNDMYPLCQKC